jgi:hypothetical protein
MDKSVMQTKLPKFITPKNLNEAKIQCINLGNNINEHAYILGKNLTWVKQKKKGEFEDWISKNLWFKRATAYNYKKFAKTCDEKGRLLDYSHWLNRLRFGEFENQKGKLVKNASKYEERDTKILLGKFQEVGLKIPDSSVNMICTDPPWDKAWLPQWNDLGELAKRVLTPGGYLFTVFGKIFLPEVLSSLNKHLKYYGLFILRFQKGTSKLAGSNIVSQFNTILGFYKPPPKKSKNWVRDIFKVGREKDFHEWQQAQQPVSYLIRKFTDEGDSILDPCGGSGTVAVVCENIGRRCTVIEMEEEAIHVIKGRLALQQQGKEEYPDMLWTDLGTQNPMSNS